MRERLRCLLHLNFRIAFRYDGRRIEYARIQKLRASSRAWFAASPDEPRYSPLGMRI
ncbi:hypothetical protein ACVWXO_009915 [Bradyrhizobium sp. LM2.7]